MTVKSCGFQLIGEVESGVVRMGLPQAVLKEGFFSERPNSADTVCRISPRTESFKNARPCRSEFADIARKAGLKSARRPISFAMSHYLRLLKVEKTAARRFYETEALRNKRAMLKKGLLPRA